MASARVWGFQRPCLLVGVLLILALACAVSSTDILKSASEDCVPGCVCHPHLGEVDCSNIGLTKVPDFSGLPFNFTILKLNLSDNFIKELYKRDFQNLTEKFNHLELRRNGLRWVEDETFSFGNLNTPHLFVYLSENELESLPENVFRGGYFQILDLSYNKLTSPPRALAQSRHISSLKLNNNPLNGLTNFSFDGIKGVSVLELSFCELTVANVDPAAFAAVHTMKSLYLDGNHFESLNRTFFVHMPDNLLNLHLRECGIRELQSRTFWRVVRRLATLYLDGNNFGDNGLAGNAFLGLRLNTLDLSRCNISQARLKGALRTEVYNSLFLDYNDLRTITPNEFSNVKGLKELHLSHCNISEIRGNPFAKIEDGAIVYLDLDNNNLDDDDMASALAPLSYLITLHASVNSLTRFPDLGGNKFPLLTDVYLAENNIEEVRREQLRNMTSLKVLDLKSNYRLRVFEEDALAECPYIDELNVEHTQLTRLPSFQNASRLQLIHATDSWIEALPEDLCEHVPLLSQLDVSLNRISAIPSFSRCRALQSLILYHNRITELKRDTFAKLTLLKTLKLEYNLIGSLPEGVFRDLASLEHLHMDRNSIRHLPAGVFDSSRNLAVLDMSHNHVRELPKNLFRNNTFLDFISFDFNNIKSIHRSVFPSGMRHLAVLRLSYNDFDSLHVPKGGFPNLHSLGLRNLYGLHRVPSKSDIPNVRQLNLTYSYHCCIWRKELRDDLKGVQDPKENTTTLDVYGTDVVTFPTDIVPIGPTLEECYKNGRISVEQLNHFRGMEEAFEDLRIEVLPNCEVDMHFDWETLEDDLWFPTAPPRPNYKPTLAPRTSDPTFCLPRPTELTPCDNLMDPWVLRVAIWAIWVLAVLGNATVLFVTIMSREKIEVPQLLICNLAVADFCLGVYLAFLAIVDVRTYGDKTFPQAALEWQLGSGCKTAGWIAVFSSELSVFMLVILTLERLHTIAYAFDHKEEKRKRVAIVAVIIAWLFAALLATLPLVGVNSYTHVVVCLPFVTEEYSDKAYIGSILTLNLLAFLIILACYSYIFFRIRKSPLASQNKKEVYSAAAKIAVLIFTAFACWFPLAVIGFAALDDKPLVSAREAKFFIVFVYPLNACVNPFVYAIFTRHFRQRVWSIFKRTRSKVHSFPGPTVLRIQRTTNPEPNSRLQSPRAGNAPPTLEDLQRLRWGRRNSFSVQLVNTGSLQSPSPPTPGSARMGRRASLPAVFGSTVHSASAQVLASSPGSMRAATPAERRNVPNYSLPFRLGPMYTAHNSSLPNLVEEQEEEEEEEEEEVPVAGLSGSQVSSDSGFRRLSVVDEEPVEMNGEEEGCDDASVTSTDSEDYSDAHNRTPSPVNVFIERSESPGASAQPEPLALVPLRHHTSASGSLNAVAVHPLDKLVLPADSAVGVYATPVSLRNGSRDSGHVTMHSSNHTSPDSNSASNSSIDSSSPCTAQDRPSVTFQRRGSVDSSHVTELQGLHNSAAAAAESLKPCKSCRTRSAEVRLTSRGSYGQDLDNSSNTTTSTLVVPTSRYGHARSSSLDTFLTVRHSLSPAGSNRSQVIRIENPNFKTSLSSFASETEV